MHAWQTGNLSSPLSSASLPGWNRVQMSRGERPSQSEGAAVSRESRVSRVSGCRVERTGKLKSQYNVLPVSKSVPPKEQLHVD